MSGGFKGKKWTKKHVQQIPGTVWIKIKATKIAAKGRFWNGTDFVDFVSAMRAVDVRYFWHKGCCGLLMQKAAYTNAGPSIQMYEWWMSSLYMSLLQIEVLFSPPMNAWEPRMALMLPLPPFELRRSRKTAEQLQSRVIDHSTAFRNIKMVSIFATCIAFTAPWRVHMCLTGA
jgi:hypothetical protein